MSQNHSSSIAANLASSLSLLEAGASNLAPAAIHDAIVQTWIRLERDLSEGLGDLSESYLSDLHRQLASRAGGIAPGSFHGGASWASFVEEASAEEPIEPAWVLAQLRWGEHVRSLPLTLGWLAMNIALIADSGEPIVPPIADHERLLKYLDYAGPDLGDAESLRALIGVYRAEQHPHS